MINIFKILTRYFDELLNEDEKKLLLQTSKICENIKFNKIDKNKLRCFNIKNFCGSIEMLEFATDKRNKNKYIVDEKTTYYLKNVIMFEYIQNNYKEIKFTDQTIIHAFNNRNIENIIWLKNNENLENIEWFEEGKLYLSILASAFFCGNVEYMIWLNENKCFLCPRVLMQVFNYINL